MTGIILAKAIPRIHELMLSVTSAAEAKRGADFCRATEILAARQGVTEIEDQAYSSRIDFLRIEGEYLERNGNDQGRPKINIPNGNNFQSLKDQGISLKESSLAQRVCRVAKEVPSLFRQIKVREAKLSDISRHFKKRAHAAKIKAASRNEHSTPKGPFELILADPPWRYEHCEAVNREIENQYPTLSLKQIAANKPHACTDSILLLWATAPKLAEAISIIDAWGFNYRTCAVWDKQVIGMGYWFRIQHELLLLAVKGNPAATPECERVSSVFSERRRKHSQKPLCIYQWIERSFPDLKKLEMYCRSPRPGWANHGNEI